MTEAVEAARAEVDPPAPVTVEWHGLEIVVPDLDAWGVIGVQLAERKGNLGAAMVARLGEAQAEAIYEHAVENGLTTDDYGQLLRLVDKAGSGESSGEAQPPRS